MAAQKAVTAIVHQGNEMIAFLRESADTERLKAQAQKATADALLLSQQNEAKRLDLAERQHK